MIPWAYRSIFSQPCDLASFPEVFSRCFWRSLSLRVMECMWRLPRSHPSLAGKVASRVNLLRCCLRSLRSRCLLGRSIQLLCVATLRICIGPRRPLVSGASCAGRAMRPTCTLAVVQDLETHCTGMSRVSMRLVAVQSGSFLLERHEARRWFQVMFDSVTKDLTFPLVGECM